MEELVVDICTYLVNNSNNDIRLEEIENYFHYNKYYLIRLFKNYTGHTMTEFINSIRVFKSIDPLIYTDETILKIALLNGFNSQEYYSEKFNEIIGMAPIKFRKIYSNIDNIKSNENKIKLINYYNSIKDYQYKMLNINNKTNVKKLVKIAK